MWGGGRLAPCSYPPCPPPPPGWLDGPQVPPCPCPQVGWTGLKSLYATVASSVEQAARTQGYQVDLGARAVSASVAKAQESTGAGGRSTNGCVCVGGGGSWRPQHPTGGFGGGGRRRGCMALVGGAERQLRSSGSGSR